LPPTISGNLWCGVEMSLNRGRPGTPRANRAWPSGPAGSIALILALAGFIVFALYSSLTALLARSAATAQLSEGSSIDRIVEALRTTSKAERQLLEKQQRDILTADKLNRDAIVGLALIYQANGEAIKAARLISAAAKRTPREGRSQVLALEIAIKSGQWRQAVAMLDILIRTQPEAQVPMFSALAALAESDRARPAVLQRLLSPPPWRSAFLLWTAEKSGKPQLAYRIISDLKLTTTDALQSEIQAVLRQYVQKEDYAAAHFVWLDLLSATDLAKVKNVFDGGFDLPFTPLYFTWTPQPANGVDVRTVPRSSDAADRVLCVEFANNRGHVAPIVQYLRLSPADYTLTVEARSEDLVTESGLVWYIQCADGNRASLGATLPLKGDTTWGRSAVSFRVSHGCATQMIGVSIASGNILDQRISGRAYFDNVAIVRAAK
jgi:hypothetical protein